MVKVVNFFKSRFFADKLILVSGGIAFLSNIIIWILLLIKFGYSHERVPLHYNLITGIDFVGDTRQIYQMPFFGLLIAVVNFLLAKPVYATEKLYGYFLCSAAAIVQIILLAAAVSIVHIL